MHHFANPTSRLLDQFEAFTNLGHEELNIKDVSENDTETRTSCSQFVNQHPAYLEAFEALDIRGELVRKYLANKRIGGMPGQHGERHQYYHQHKQLQVHVHIRRGVSIPPGGRPG